jgi:hypothetical protein
MTIGVDYYCMYLANILNEYFLTSMKSSWFNKLKFEFIMLLESFLGSPSLPIDSIFSENYDMAINVMIVFVQLLRSTKILLNWLLILPFWIFTRFIFESIGHFNAFINVVIC